MAENKHSGAGNLGETSHIVEVEVVALKRLEKLYKLADKMEANGKSHEAAIIRFAAEQSCVHGNHLYMNALDHMRFIPVTIQEFVESDEYLGAPNLFPLWPKLKEVIYQCKPHPMLTKTPINEIIYGGATGAGKSFVGLVSMMYDLYFFLCFNTPQALFKNLAINTPILFSFQTNKFETTKRNIYNPFRRVFTNIPFVQKYFPYNKNIDAELIFPEALISCVPLKANRNAFMGQNLAAAFIDECLPKDTLIYTPKGNIPLEQIQVGDLVGSFDENKRFSYQFVTNKRLTGTKNIVKISTETSWLCVSENHPILTEDGWKNAKDVQVSDKLFTLKENNYKLPNLVMTEVIEVEDWGRTEVFNLEVEETHTFFANNIAVHNCNFMERIEESRKKGGEVYDQAEEVCYEAISRRNSRFATTGPSPGAIVLMSSAAYVGDFIDKRMEKYNPERDVRVFALKKKRYEVKPIPAEWDGTYFHFLVGTDQYNGRILTDEDLETKNYPPGAWVEKIPFVQELYDEFIYDPVEAQRNIMGISSGAITRYIGNPKKIHDAVDRFKRKGYKIWTDTLNIDLAQENRLPTISYNRLPENRSAHRFVHVDLSRTDDRCGIAVVRIDNFVERTQDIIELVPYFVVELAISIKPNTVNELQIPDVRNWVQSLKLMHDINIRLVTYDGFQSYESIQLLRKAGIKSMELSVDKTPDAYETVKNAFYEDRIDMCPNEIAVEEFIMLERRMRGDTFKIDHSAKFSKDISDAIAGACYAASTYAKSRGEYGLSGRKKRQRPRRQRRRK